MGGVRQEDIQDRGRELRNFTALSVDLTLRYVKRQFDRLLEMLLLRELDEKDAARVKAYRLGVKARLFRFNYVRAALIQPFALLRP